MRERDGAVTQDMREMVKRFKPDADTLRLGSREISMTDVKNAAFVMIQANDRAMAATVWLAGYNMAVAGHGDFDPTGLDAKAVHDRAVNFADRAARTQASSFRADLTAMQRDQGMMRFFTMFMSGNVRRWGMRTLQYWDAVRQGHIGPADFAWNFMAEMAFPAWFQMLMHWLFFDLFGADDDEQTWGGFAWSAATAPLEEAVSGFPVVSAVPRVLDRGARGAMPPMIEKPAEAIGRVGRGGRALVEGDYERFAWELGNAVAFGTGLSPAMNLVQDLDKLAAGLGVTDERMVVAPKRER